MNLKQQYEKSVHAYCKEFYQNHYCEGEEDCRYDPYWWVGEEVGGVLCVNRGDIYLNFDDIRRIVDHNIPLDNWIDWFYWQLEDPENNRMNVDVWYKLEKSNYSLQHKVMQSLKTGQVDKEDEEIQEFVERVKKLSGYINKTDSRELESIIKKIVN